MKLLNKIVLITALLAVPLAATHAEQHKDKMGMGMDMENKMKGMDMENKMKGMGMEAMTDEQMSKMQQHMQEMDALLTKVKQETDQDKRDAMLTKHAEGMENMMAMMNGDHAGKENDAKMMKDHTAMTPDAHLKMLEQRMAMMEKMMGQVMGHTVEKSKMGHAHKKN